MRPENRRRRHIQGGSAIPIMMSGVVGAVLGVISMYLADPRSGARRRSVLFDRARRMGHEAARRIGQRSRDLSHRMRGMAYRSTATLRIRDVSDEQLESRIRSRIGRAVSHPGLVRVHVRDRHVSLTGRILDGERRGLIAAVRHVPGVSGVEDRLEMKRMG
jgi:hypothetical protein